MSKVLVISEDIVGKKMAGPAIRCLEMAKALGANHEVVLAIPQTNLEEVPTITGVIIRSYDGKILAELVDECNIVIIFGYLAYKFPFLKEVDKSIIVDIYDPFALENLEIHKGESIKQRVETHFFDQAVLNNLLEIGDFFVCASEKQRNFWLGMLAALGRINPETYDDDAKLRKLIDVVPFGIPDIPPQHSKFSLKGIHPGIGEKDKVVLWGGGIYNWFDPITLLHALDLITKRRTDIKLFFLGVSHPNPDIPQMKMCTEAINLSKRLGLEGKYVFFNQWAPYEERNNYLLEADIGISIHLEHLETEFSFRTRVLDYIWAGLPIITTKGDFVADLVDKKSLGLVVDYEDVEQLAKSIEHLIDDTKFNQKCQDNLKELAPIYTWRNAVKPLDNFCNNPCFAPDKSGLSKKFISGIDSGSTRKSTAASTRKFFYYIREEGPKSAVTRVAQHAKKRITGK